jgi:general secretion pathway protein E/type IV pilus assembly protein PilB
MSEPVIQASTSSQPIRKPLDARQLALARQAQSTRGRLDQVAAELGLANEEEALKAVAAALGLEFVDLSSTKPDLGLLRRFPIKLIHRHNVFPLRLEEESLVLAIGNPFNLDAVDAVGAATGQSVLPVVVFPTSWPS